MADTKACVARAPVAGASEPNSRVRSAVLADVESLALVVIGLQGRDLSYGDPDIVSVDGDRT
jgi:hypothetical protein